MLKESQIIAAAAAAVHRAWTLCWIADRGRKQKDKDQKKQKLKSQKPIESTRALVDS